MTRGDNGATQALRQSESLATAVAVFEAKCTTINAFNSAAARSDDGLCNRKGSAASPQGKLSDDAFPIRPQLAHILVGMHVRLNTRGLQSKHARAIAPRNR